MELKVAINIAQQRIAKIELVERPRLHNVRLKTSKKVMELVGLDREVEMLRFAIEGWKREVKRGVVGSGVVGSGECGRVNCG